MAGLSCGIVGLPNVGKSTLFNALTANEVEAANYPFCTIDPNIGIVDKEDDRLPILSQMSKSKKILYANVQFVDIAGLVAGASKGEGLGNQFLSHIRETDAIVQVVRCFESDDVIHVGGRVNPIADMETINQELLLADLQVVEKILPRVEKQMKGNKELQAVYHLYQRILEHLNANQPVRTMEFTPEELESMKTYPELITRKKMLYLANVGEEDLPSMENAYVQQVREYAQKEGALVVPICAKLEAEIAQLSPEERQEFLESLGLKESGLQRLVKTSFSMLGLITYLTTGEIETRAWTIKKGESAPEAAGKIHSDIQKGFIRAEIVSFDAMEKHGSWAAAKSAGQLRIEGKDYIVQDGDVINFLHGG